MKSVSNVCFSSLLGKHRSGSKHILSMSRPMATVPNSETGSESKVVSKPISQALLKETVQTLFEQIDMDDNGVIDMEEFQNLAGI